MGIKVNYNNMMERAIGEQGISEREYASYAEFAREAHRKVEQGRGKAMQGWMDSPYNQDDIVKRLNETAKSIRKSCD